MGIRLCGTPANFRRVRCLRGGELDDVRCYLFEAGAIRRFASFSRNFVAPRTTFVGRLLLPDERKIKRLTKAETRVIERALAMQLPQGRNAEGQVKQLCANARVEYDKARNVRGG